MTDAARVQYSPAASDAALLAFALQAGETNPAVHVPTSGFSAGLMGALVRAELMAAHAGVVPLDTSDAAGMGVQRIGAALEHIDSAPEPIRTIYLATHAAVARATEAAKESGEFPPDTIVTKARPADFQTVAASPLVIGLVVLGVVAVAAAAWGISRENRKTVELPGIALRDIALAARAAELQTAGTPPEAPVWKILQELAKRPNPNVGGPGMSFLVVFTMAALVGGAWLYARSESRR